MRGGARGAHMPICHHVTTLATTSSRANSKTLPTHEVLAYRCVVFHRYTSRLRGGTAAIAAALICYDDVEVATRTTMRRRQSYSKLMWDYVGSLLQLFFCCTAHLVVTIYDLLLANFLG
jgi:hypothetical protein